MKRRAFIALLGGAAAGAPFAAIAQPARKIPVVGILWHAGTAQEEGPNFTAVIEGFKALGYVDGQNSGSSTAFPMKLRSGSEAWRPNWCR